MFTPLEFPTRMNPCPTRPNGTRQNDVVGLVAGRANGRWAFGRKGHYISCKEAKDIVEFHPRDSARDFLTGFTFRNKVLVAHSAPICKNAKLILKYERSSNV